jgi:hypothetical protein
MAHLSSAQLLAAGLRPPPSLARPMTAVQAAWRFYSNPQLTLPELAAPLRECARADVPAACENHVLVALDWCLLHYADHASKQDRVVLNGSTDLGYELLNALAISDRDGSPIAPLCFELRADDGLHTTRAAAPLPAPSVLDGLEPVMEHVANQNLGREPVFIIDREADSVAHYRQWMAQSRRFVVRANDARLVLYEGQERRLIDVACGLQLTMAREVKHKGKPATQFVGECPVVLHRPARAHRIEPETGRKKHRDIKGEPLPLRLVVSEVRDKHGRVLARWLLLSSLPESASPALIALWYYWRWRIESYHKLLKGAGQQLESWQQESGAALTRRLLVAAMSAVVVWRLAREKSEHAAKMREMLIRLSGRQMKYGTSFTEPALMAGLGILLPMLDLLHEFDVEEIRQLTEATFPQFFEARAPSPRRQR